MKGCVCEVVKSLMDISGIFGSDRMVRVVNIKKERIHAALFVVCDTEFCF